MKVRTAHKSSPLDHGDEQNIILDSIADGVFTVDHDWRITSFNRAAEKITGVPRKEAVGQLCRGASAKTPEKLFTEFFSGTPQVGESASDQ